MFLDLICLGGFAFVHEGSARHRVSGVLQVSIVPSLAEGLHPLDYRNGNVA